MTELANGGVKKPKKTKNQIRRERLKARKVAGGEDRTTTTPSRETTSFSPQNEVSSTTNIEAAPSVSSETAVVESTTRGGRRIETEDSAENSDIKSEPNPQRSTIALSNIFDSDIDQSLNDPRFAQYKLIFNKFYTEENLPDKTLLNSANGEAGQVFYSDDEGDIADDSDNENDAQNSGSQLTKKKLKQLRKLPLALLKSQSRFPEIVEWYDADAADPDLLVQLKSSRGAVPVPDHWLSKKEFLSSKRGLMRQPFELPDFIKDTGIMDMRDALKEDETTLRQRTRERVQPKMGRLDIDYQKLHNAFFKFQTKPRLFGLGDVYYEGKENEIDFSKFRPGKLSSRLKKALNIPVGAPPPWLLNMQRYGPPPSYPGLRIPGLNAPLPSGAQWGFQPGGWGRAPVDSKGAPLYGGDLNGVIESGGGTKLANKLAIPVEKHPWGQMIDDEGEEEDEEEDEDEDDDDDEEDDEEGQGYVDEDTAAAAAANTVETSSTGAPGFELRKSKRSAKELDDEFDGDGGDDDDDKPVVVPTTPSGRKQLFQVLEQSESSAEPGFMGKQRTYDIPASSTTSQPREERKRRRFEEPTSEEFQSSLNDLLESEKSKVESSRR